MSVQVVIKAAEKKLLLSNSWLRISEIVHSIIYTM
jgi:hypothetical protein